MRKKMCFVFVLLIVCMACTKFEKAELTQRTNFVHFFSSGTNFIASTAEVDTDGGYILSGEVRYPNGVTDAYIIKTDLRGHKVWEKVIPNGLINAIKPTADGYILLGDGIELNTTSPSISELVNTTAKLLLMDKLGNVVAERIMTDSVPRIIDGEPIQLTIDYHGNGITLDPSGNIIVLGTFREPDKNEYSFLWGFNPTNLDISLPYRSYSLLGRDYVNCNALHLTPSSDFLWAVKTFKRDQNVPIEYASILSAKPEANVGVFISSPYGENDPQNHSVADIQPSGLALGYGAIGTYSETTGANANIYFMRTDAFGTIIESSVRYIDGETLLLNNEFLTGDPRLSSSQDEGTALIGIDDGYVLATTMTSTPSVGNGGQDLLLIKLDPFGNLVWKKLIGGTGDETVTSIRETDDGLLIFGTNTINGLSSLMLMKTDANGEIRN
jgi:hypothetical protein